MKKKKTGDREGPHFKNHPFHSLKKFKPAGSPRAVVQAKKGPGPAQTEDAGEVFLRAMSGVRKIDDEPTEPRKKESQPAPSPEKSGDQQLFLQAMQKLRTKSFEEEPEEELSQPRSSSSRMKQLRRGTIGIREELDLHGLFRDEALARLAVFIAAAYNRGERAVLVITGKGNNSPEGPVLQGAVSEWFRHKGRQMVAEFAPAPRDKGGSGAFVVFLRSRG